MNQRDYKKYEEDYEVVPFEPILVEYRRKIVIENLLKYSHNNILEIGCGYKPLFKYFSDYSSMTIIEPGKSFYKNACALKNNSNIKIYNDLFENIADNLKINNFDFIIISALLHEIPDLIEFLKRVHDISNIKTTIHINVPNAKSIHRILAFEMGLIDSIFEFSPTNIKMQQYRVFNMKSLTEVLADQKFKILDTGSYFIKPFTHSQMAQMIKNEIIDQKILDGLFTLTRHYPDSGSEIFVNCTIC